MKLKFPFRGLDQKYSIFAREKRYKDKAIAGAQLAAEIPDLKKNLSGFKDILKKAGVADAGSVVDSAMSEATNHANNTAVKGLNNKLATELSADELTKLDQLASKVGSDDLEKILSKVDNKETLKGLMGQLNELDASAGKRLLKSLGEMENGVLGEALKNPDIAKSLGKLAVNLDDDAAESAGKLFKEMDKDALKAFLKFSDNAPAGILKEGLKAIGPAVEAVGSKVASQAIKLLDGILGKMGVTVTKEAAEKVFKTLGKIIPAVGAVPCAIDAAKYTKEAIDLNGKNKDLAMFATVGASLNTVDGVLGIALDATGIGVVADIGVGIGFGIAELALDLAFDSEKEKLAENPDTYKAPDWMKAVNLGFAATSGPAGLGMLLANYGVDGTADLVKWGIDSGVKGAEGLVTSLKDAGEEGIKALKELAGKGINVAKDVLKSIGETVDGIVDTGKNLVNKGLDIFGL